MVLEMTDYYNLLGIDAAAAPAAIRAAFRHQAKRFHPDTQPHLKGVEKDQAQTRFIQLAQAYETLIDPKTRAEYDRKQHPVQDSAGQGRPRNGAASSPTRPGARPPPKDGEQQEAAESVTLDDLIHDVEDLLGRFGLDLKLPIELIFEELLQWAMKSFERVFDSWLTAERTGQNPAGTPSGGETAGGPSTRPRQGADGAHGPTSRRGKPAPRRDRPAPRRATGKAVEQELADIKRRVRAGMRARKRTTRGRSPVEEELSRLKERSQKKD